MSHTALARKYRPRRFAEVATQAHVSETLRRAVAASRVGHAYLFTGPRGVGKTTVARVLAMALNCPDRAPEGEPCGECESCLRIWGGYTSLDVVEIDAASNRGVDDARELRERAMYAPSEESRYKVYILDEAHMLTREAWNALLKILEEPPPRVIFVFATTEPTKIQQTAAPILSRCQRFDFRRIGVSDILGRLEEVLASEGVRGSPEALRTIARKADGGMRDALSLLDQVLVLTDRNVELESVRRVLGLVEEERYLELLDLLLEGLPGEVFPFVSRLLDEGYDLLEFYHGLVETLRSLLQLRMAGGGPPELREDLVDAFRERATALEPGDLIRMLTMATELDASGGLRRSDNPRTLLELLLLRLAYVDRTVELEDLIRTLGGEPEARGQREPRSAARNAPLDSAAPTAGARGAAPTSVAPGAQASSEFVGPREGPASEVATTPVSTLDFDSPQPALQLAPEMEIGGERGGLEGAWLRLLEPGGALPPGLRPFLLGARVEEQPEGVVRIDLPLGPGRERLEEPEVRSAVAVALSGELGRRVEVTLDGEAEEGREAGPRITNESVKEHRLKELYAREPLLERAVEELDLDLME